MSISQFCSAFLFHYCKGLIECPIILSPFRIIQQGHFWSRQTAAWSCLQTEQMHCCCCIFPNSSISFFSLRDLSSAYNHKNTTGIPIAKKMIIVRTGTRKVNNAKPKITAPMPRAASQRFVRLSAFKFKPLFQPLYLLYVGSLFILNISVVIRFTVTWSYRIHLLFS